METCIAVSIAWKLELKEAFEAAWATGEHQTYPSLQAGRRARDHPGADLNTVLGETRRRRACSQPRHLNLGWTMGFEPTTAGVTIRSSTS